MRCFAFSFAVLAAFSCTPRASVGEGEGEGAAGEGEGEGEGASCASSSKFAAAGTDYVLSAATFSADQNATCTTGNGFSLQFHFSPANGQGYEPFFDKTNVAVADNGVPAHDGTFGTCDGGVTVDANCDGIQDCSFTCSLCYTTAPTDLAVEVDDTGNTLSNALCVLP
jgi:hypothetical protein